MATRRCGYCRDYNHRADKCTVMSNQIAAVRAHVYGERMAIHDILTRNGYGVGCILEGPDGVVYTIRSLRDSLRSPVSNYVEWRNIKYQKSVRSTLKSVSGIRHHNGDAGDLIRYDHQSHLYIYMNPLNDLNGYNYGVISLGKLSDPPNNPLINREFDYYNNRHVKVLSPSSDTDMTEQDFMESFRLHERLGKDDRGYGKIVLPLKPTT